MRPDDITPEEHDEARMMLTPDGDECLAALVAQNALRDERVRAAERERIAAWIEQESQAPVYKADDIDVVIRSLGRVIRREGGDTNAQ